jgi:uncharacterized protein (TIGR03435 family)
MQKFLFASLWIASVALGENAKPTFDVASIKAAEPIQKQVGSGKIHIGMKIDGARVDIGFMSLSELIPIAYAVKPYQVTGPSWFPGDRFDIVATIPEGVSKDKVPEMLRALLEERFKLTIHRETKERPVYVLIVAKGGPKLKDSEPDPIAPPQPAEAAPGTTQGVTFGTAQGEMRINPTRNGMTANGPTGPIKAQMTNGVMHIEYAKASIPMFIDMISRMVDKPVLDMTELKGTYQIGLDLSMEEMMGMARAAGVGVPGMPGGGGGDPSRPADAASVPSGGAIFATVQQLGLKLDPRKLPVDTIVVDHLEKAPTEN